MARVAEVIARLSMPVYEPLHVFRRAPHRTRSHSFASTISLDRSIGSAGMITILPVLSISTRAICTPAAVTALTALVTSCCRNVDGARGISPPLHQQIERADAFSPFRFCRQDIAHFNRLVEL